MIEILACLGIALVMVALLSLLPVTWQIRVDDPADFEADRRRAIPARDTALCVCRIFSPEDRQFVEREGFPRLRHIYRAERAGVALYWVRSTAREVGSIMREHRAASRSSQDLQVGRELGLMLKYFEFRVLCGLLIFSIRLFGPAALQDLAGRALAMSQSISQAIENTTAAGRIGTAGNLGGA